MKILCIDRYFYPDGQATACILTDLVEHLSLEHDVQVIYGCPSRSFSQIQNNDNSLHSFNKRVVLTPVWSSQFSKKSIFGRVFNYISFYVSVLVKLFFCSKPDLIIVMTSPPYIGFSGVVMKYWKKVPFILVCQDLFPESAQTINVIRNQWVGKILKRLQTILLNYANHVVVISYQMKERLIKKNISVNKISIIENWTDSDKVLPGLQKNDFSVSQGFENKFIVLCAGNLGYAHSLMDVLNAAKQLRNNQEILFLIVGDGVMKGELTKFVHHNQLLNVRFYPFLPKVKLQDVFASASVLVVALKPGLTGYVVPSRIYSYLAGGRAIIGISECGSETDTLIRTSGAGMVVAPGDNKGFVRCIENLYKDKALRELYGSNALLFLQTQKFKEKGLLAYSKLINTYVNNDDEV